MKDKEVDQKVIDQIFSSIEKGNAVIGKEHETIIVIGDTGSGKSTLINYLSGVPLIVKKTLVGLSESFIINTKKVGEGVKIGDTTVAETTVPNNWKDDANGIVYWDCPGFKDTRGPVQDIPNAFYIKKVFDNSDILKIVVVVEASAFSSVRGQPFVTQIELLSHLFKNIDDFKNGLSLVITKVPPGATIEIVKTAIARILTEQQDELTPDQIKIGKFLASVDSKIALFNLPQAEGPLLLENRDILLSTIADTQSVNKAEVNVPISTESRLYVMELFNKTSLKVTELLKEKFLDIKLKHAQLLDVENLPEVARLVSDTKELKELFFSTGENLKNLQDVFGKISPELMTCFSNLVFFKQADPDDCDTGLLIGAIQDNLLPTLDTLMSNTTGKVVEGATKIIDKFIENINEDIKQKSLLDLQKYVDILEKVHSGSVDLQTLNILNDTLVSDLKFPMHLNIPAFDSYIKMFKVLDKEPHAQTKGRLVELIETTYKNAKKDYKAQVTTLEQSIYGDLDKSFKEICDNFVKIYSGYDKLPLKQSKSLNAKLQQSKDLNQKFKGLIASFPVSGSFSLASVIEKIEIDILTSMNNSEILGAIGTIKGVLKTLEQTKVDGIKIQQPNVQKYLVELSQTVGAIQNLYTNLSDKYVEVFDQDISISIKEFMLKTTNFYKASHADKVKQKLLCKILEGSAAFVQSPTVSNLFKCIEDIRDKLISNGIGLDISDLNDIMITIDTASSLEDPSKLLNYDNWKSRISETSQLITAEDYAGMIRDSIKSNISDLSINIEKCIQNIASDSKSSSIGLIIKKLEWLKDIMSSFLEKPVDLGYFIGYFSEHLKHYPLSIQKPLAQLSAINEPGIKIDIEMVSELIKLPNKIQEAVNWYGEVSKMYNHLSTTNAPSAYVEVKDSNFKSFIKNIGADGAKNIESDAIKVSQLTALVKSTWGDIPNVKQENSYETVTITGNCVKMSDISQYVTPNTKLVKIKCLNTIIIDQDLIAPTTNMIVVAPRWKVQGNVAINLCGKNAESLGVLKALDGVGYKVGKNGQDGTDGLPGLPGINGGNFYGMGYEFIGLNNLTINTSGGKGSKGQEGGKGADGQAGQDASVANNSGVHGTMYKGFPGGIGGHGGKGGAGGIGGHTGKIEILKGLDILFGNFICEQGENGLNGTSGLPGVGSKDGNDYYYHSYQQGYTAGGGKNTYTAYRTVVDQKVIPISTKATDGINPIEKNTLNQQRPESLKTVDQFLQSQIKDIKVAFQAEFDFSIKLNSDFVDKLQTPMLINFLKESNIVEPGTSFGDGDTNFDGYGMSIHEHESYWNAYSKEGIIKLLQLRLESAQIEGIKIVCPNYVWDGSIEVAEKLNNEIIARISSDNKQETLLVVLNLYGKHWVGMVVEKNDSEITISYMDPEQGEVPKLLQDLLENRMLQEYPEYTINFAKVEVEQQRYNNCGPEVIENFIEYLTEERVNQEDVSAIHSLIFEDTLLLGNI